MYIQDSNGILSLSIDVDVYIEVYIYIYISLYIEMVPPLPPTPMSTRVGELCVVNFCVIALVVRVSNILA